MVKLLIIILGLLVFGNTLFNGFVWDDEELILLNSQVHSLANLPAFFAGSTFNSGGAGGLAGLYYKPLMTTAFSAIYTLFGPNAFFFHLFQISLHIASALFLWAVFRSLPLTLIFLVHPLNTETVVYLADYQEVLFFFFGIASFWYLLKTKSPNLFLAAGLFLGAMLSKETGFVFLGIIGIGIWLFARTKLKISAVALTMAGLIYIWLRFGVAHIFFNKHGLTPMSLASLPERLINIPAIIFFYLKTFFWPQNLTINQQWIVAKIDPLILTVNIIFFAGLIAGFFLTKSKKLYFFFFLWFLLGLGLHLQIFPLDLTVSDRWFYLPMVGLLGMITIIFKDFLSRPVFLGIIIFILATRTFWRTFDWRDGYTLYSHDIISSPEAFDLQNNLGVELFRRGDFSQAKVHFEKSVELSPQWWTNWNNLGAIYEREGKLDLAKDAYQKAIDHGHYYLAYENMAKLLLKTDPAAGRKFVLESLKLFPGNLVLNELK